MGQLGLRGLTVPLCIDRGFNETVGDQRVNCLTLQEDLSTSLRSAQDDGRILEARGDGADEVLGVEDDGIWDGGDSCEVAGHFAGGNRVKGGTFKAVGKFNEVRCVVKFASFAKSAGPRKNSSYRIGGSLFAFEVLVVMALHRTMGGFILVVAMRAYEN